MRRILLMAACVLLLSPGMAAAKPIPGAYIVTLESGDPDAAAEKARGRGADVSHVYKHAIRGYAARMSEKAAAQLAQQPGVASVVEDQEVHAYAAPPLPTGIDRIDGELSSTVAGNGAGTVDVDVAVIDTGISAHPDLHIAGGRDCQTGSGYGDGNGHGTHVAGTIGAKDDANGVVGVAPGARLWAVRVLNRQGSGSWSSIICGIDWVTENAGRIEVANMSLGGTGSEGNCSDGGMREAICESVKAGVTYVVAAGNSGVDSKTHVPASYDEVITVSALADFDGKVGGLAAATCRADKDDTFATFSNYGLDVDLIAPGVCIRSTWTGGGYNTISGTSMASPHVAGAAALVKAANPGFSPERIKAELQTSGTLDWDNSDDGLDGTKERLLNVAGF